MLNECSKTDASRLIYPTARNQTENKLCAWRHNMPPPYMLTISSYLFARWHLFWHIGYLRHQQQVDL